MMDAYQDFTKHQSVQSNSVSVARGDYNIKDHIVICNWTSKADSIVRQLHDESVVKKSPIIVVTNRPQDVPSSTEEEYRGLLIINGDPADREILERADIQKASVAVILADETKGEEPDSKSILIQLAIDAINAKVHTIVELVHSSSEMYFTYTHANELVCLEQLSEKLLAQAALTPGVSKVYLDLLTQSSNTNEIYEVEIIERFVGQSFEEVKASFLEIARSKMILFGFATTDCKRDNKGECIVDPYGEHIPEQKVVINPPIEDTNGYSGKYILKKSDTLFIISYNKPALEKLFSVTSKK